MCVVVYMAYGGSCQQAYLNVLSFVVSVCCLYEDSLLTYAIEGELLVFCASSAMNRIILEKINSIFLISKYSAQISRAHM